MRGKTKGRLLDVNSSERPKMLASGDDFAKLANALLAERRDKFPKSYAAGFFLVSTHGKKIGIVPFRYLWWQSVTREGTVRFASLYLALSCIYAVYPFSPAEIIVCDDVSERI